MSLTRQNYSLQAEQGVNAQINIELTASYVYQSLAAYFDRDDVALPGFRDYFQKSSDEEREHAQKFIKYQNQRGGRVVLEAIQKPTVTVSTAVQSLEAALTLERHVNEKLLALHKVASDNTDPHLSDFLEEHFLDEQVEAIKKLADLITRLKLAGEGLGVYLFDKDLK
eukprot:TRINITY_DN118_c0_g1_i1.p1 TRINITY_DN118_c0_g1~~TRINITY_DN118_c0_g1_i1.p1  ORF type:complete len:168 (+),score=56.06 TRINITY_DN118_c0_g1_i1:36-539(+)